MCARMNFSMRGQTFFMIDIFKLKGCSTLTLYCDNKSIKCCNNSHEMIQITRRHIIFIINVHFYLIFFTFIINLLKKKHATHLYEDNYFSTTFADSINRLANIYIITRLFCQYNNRSIAVT